MLVDRYVFNDGCIVTNQIELQKNLGGLGIQRFYKSQKLFSKSHERFYQFIEETRRKTKN
jgi:hypothetical protein